MTGEGGNNYYSLQTSTNSRHQPTVAMTLLISQTIFYWYFCIQLYLHYCVRINDTHYTNLSESGPFFAMISFSLASPPTGIRSLPVVNWSSLRFCSSEKAWQISQKYLRRNGENVSHLTNWYLMWTITFFSHHCCQSQRELFIIHAYFYNICLHFLLSPIEQLKKGAS